MPGQSPGHRASRYKSASWNTTTPETVAKQSMCVASRDGKARNFLVVQYHQWYYMICRWVWTIYPNFLLPLWYFWAYSKRNHEKPIGVQGHGGLWMAVSCRRRRWLSLILAMAARFADVCCSCLQQGIWKRQNMSPKCSDWRRCSQRKVYGLYMKADSTELCSSVFWTIAKSWTVWGCGQIPHKQRRFAAMILHWEMVRYHRWTDETWKLAKNLWTWTYMNIALDSTHIDLAGGFLALFVVLLWILYIPTEYLERANSLGRWNMLKPPASRCV